MTLWEYKEHTDKCDVLTKQNEASKTNLLDKAAMKYKTTPKI